MRATNAPIRRRMPRYVKCISITSGGTPSESGREEAHRDKLAIRKKLINLGPKMASVLLL